MQNKAIKCEALIVGAGLLGSSTAMHLAQSGLEVMVVDLDLEGVFSSSELNAGGVRATWNHPVNAAISKISIDYYSTIASEIGFRQKGYFWMYSNEHWPKAHALLKANQNLKGLGVEYLTPTQITQRFPFIDKVQDLGGATFSPQDGLLNANLLKNHYRSEAKKAGAQFMNRLWVHKAKILDSGADLGMIELKAWLCAEHMDHDAIKKALTQNIFDDVQEVTLITKQLVNCSGAWARQFAQCLGVTCQSKALRRQVSVFECKGLDLTPYGMFVDSSGVYFHPEANYILGGYATPEEPAGYNFEYDGETFFESSIWPALYERSSLFENLKHITGWAGLYEISPDNSGIVGRVAGLKNVFEAHSFSGRGAMQSYGAGLALSELIRKNEYKSIDLSSLDGARFENGQKIIEGMLI